MISRICDDHARHQAFGRLVQQDDLGLEHHRARDRQHLLLAARQRAAGLVAPLGQHREIGVDLVQQLLLSAPWSRRGGRARCAGSPSPSAGGRCAGPREHSRSRAAPAGAPASRVIGRPSNSTLPRLGWTRPHDRLQGRALADAVAARAGPPPRPARPRARRRAGYGSCRNRCGCPRPGRGAGDAVARAHVFR